MREWCMAPSSVAFQAILFDLDNTLFDRDAALRRWAVDDARGSALNTRGPEWEGI
jgi:FMN phosphatase YigB (HAD superfamily)